eukprot:TRINITY_DN5257_c0_g1_i2.p1 TRINITY_DN5257_c0_g1~~TRINITY_DN5257_c0_g1_i2.p1  ORF type:complete len:610 (-),score=104.13 TRINITY_DN5257_c0_g1_i2:68-1897(-)
MSYLLRSGAKTNTKDSFGKIPLHYACESGDHLAVMFLLFYGSNVNTKSDEGIRPLHYAAASGSIKCVQSLNEKRCNIKSGDEKQRTPIYWAMKGIGNIDVIRYLIGIGCSPDIPNHKSIYPVHKAAMKGHLPAISALMEENVDILVETIDGRNIFHYCAMYNQQRILTFLRQSIPDLADDHHTDNLGFSPLHHAVFNNNSSNLQWFRSDFDSDDKFELSPLDWALILCYPNISNSLTNYVPLPYPPSKLRKIFLPIERCISSKYKNKKYYDVTLIVEGKPIPAHRIILSKSKYFRSLLNISEHDTVFLSSYDVKYSHACMKAYIDYLYSGKISARVTVISELSSFSKCIGNIHLRKKCQDLIRDFKSGSKLGDMRVSKNIKRMKMNKKDDATRSSSTPRAIRRRHESEVSKDQRKKNPVVVLHRTIHSMLTQYLRGLVNSSKYSDIAFRINNTLIFAHKIIVCSRSEYFEDLIDDSDTDIIELDVNENFLLVILEYLYTNTILDFHKKIPNNQVEELVGAINKYSIPDILKNIEVNYIIDIKVGNVCSYLLLGKKLGWVKLVMCCKTYIKEYLDLVSDTPGYKDISEYHHEIDKHDGYWIDYELLSQFM